MPDNQFQKYHLHNIDLVIGNFNNTLTDVLEKVEQLDFVFFDGNHRKIPTIDYFNHCLTKAGPKSIFIIDDIKLMIKMLFLIELNTGQRPVGPFGP